MKTFPNEQVTKNFSLYEFIEAHPSGSEEFKEIVWSNIAEFNLNNAKRILEFIQRKRDYINSNFRSLNGGEDIGLKITSGFRPVQWEKLQKRSGTSKHTLSMAVDVQPIKCSPELAVKILQHLYEKDAPRDSGHQGGFALKKPVIVNNVVKSIGFIHYDLRGVPDRWFY